MGAERLDRVILPRKFGFGERRMDLVMADLVEKNGGAALSAPEFGDEVMQALAHIGRNGTLTQGADWIAHD